MKIIKKWSDIARKALPSLVACAFASISGFAAANTHASDIDGNYPDRIASTSLCGDAYLLTLAPEKVSALSWQSRDALSRAPKDMRALPQAWDNTERLLSLSADFILFGSGEGYKSQKYLAKTHKRSVNLTWGEDFENVFTNLTNIGEAIGEPKQAKRKIDSIKTRLSSLTGDPNLEKPKILYLSRSGGSAGPGTLVDAAMTAAGGQNIMTKPGWFTPDPEFLISLKPDLIITSYFDDGYESVNAVPLRNKTVREFMNRYERFDIPGYVWPCAGPHLVEAAELIHEKLGSTK